jgi:hypothetical protein
MNNNSILHATLKIIFSRISLPSLILILFFPQTVLQSQWLQANNSGGTNACCIAVRGSNIFEGTIFHGVYYSSNNGTDWIQVNNGLTNNIVWSLAVNDTNLFAGTFFDVGGGVYRSTNYGTSWTQVGLNTYTIKSMAIGDKNLFAGTDRGIFSSTNNGENWTQVNQGHNEIVYSLMVSEDKIFACSDSGVYVSTNNGLDWFQINNGLSKKSTVALAINDTNIFAGTRVGVYVSNKNEINWKQLNGFKYVNTIAASGNNIFVGTDTGGVYLSTNNGASWAQINDGLTVKAIYVLALAEKYIFAGTRGAGLWMRPLSELVNVSNDASGFPRDYALSQNYPNPFNPSTTIKYSIPKTAYVTLTIYNSLGQQVATLVSKEMNAGTYTTEWNASRFASGMYYCRMVAGDFVQTRKLILLK